MSAKPANSNPTMEELLASQSQRLTLFRGQEVEGELVAINDKEIILDLGTKSEGVLSIREIPAEKLSSYKIGDKIKVFVSLPENENGQTLLSLEKQTSVREGVKGRSRGGKAVDWSKFIQAQKQKSKLSGKVIEINKGGLIVEAAGVRGFLPNSQVGFKLLSKFGAGMENLIGQDLIVTVIEVDVGNKLIFSERGPISDQVKDQLTGFKNGQQVEGQVVAILPFGLVVSLKEQSASGTDSRGVEGLVFVSDVSWEKVEDLAQFSTVGQVLQVLVVGVDQELGRVNLSIKGLTEDPFIKLVEKFPVDEVVKGEITQVTESGAMVTLNDAEGPAVLRAVEGFLPASRMNPDTQYEVGKKMNFLVDSVDRSKRRVNLAPFVTSTSGLIYK